MKIEDQVVSLKLAKKLKELGVKQESYFQWFIDEISEYSFIVSENSIVDSQREYHDRYSAFTVAELGKMLPKGTEDYYLKSIGWCEFQILSVLGGTYFLVLDTVKEEKEADARAQAIIYLIENKLI